MNRFAAFFVIVSLGPIACPARAQDVSQVQLENLLHPEVRAREIRVAILPIGSTEPHANHMPYGSDTFASGAVAARAALQANRLGARVIVFPAMPYGINTNVVAIPYAQCLRPATLTQVVKDVVDGLERHGIRKVVIINGHGGNTATLGAALRELYASHRRVFVALIDVSGPTHDQVPKLGMAPGEHASEAETSLGLALFPEKIRMDRAVAPREAPLKLTSLQAGYISFVRPWDYVSDNTGVGDPTRATADKGRKLVEVFVDRVAAFLKELSDAELSERFPF